MSSEKMLTKRLFAMMVALALTIVWLPMFAQTVKADEQIRVEVTYIYVNAAGQNSLYVDNQYVPVGTTWGEFFGNYQRCYSNGVLADANAANNWELSVQNRSYPNEADCYSEAVRNFNDYTDCALVTFYGVPAGYKHAYFGYEVLVNGEYIDSGMGWDFLIPSEYVPGGPEAMAYAENSRHMYSYIDEYCNRPGAVVTMEARPATWDGGWDGYIISIDLSNVVAPVSGDNSGSAASTSTVEPAETTYASDAGEAMRRVASESNPAIALDAAQDVVPSGARFASATVTSGEVYDRAAGLVAQQVGGTAPFRVFEMNLTDSSNTAIHQLNGFVNVTLPIPEGLSAENGRMLVVYRVEDNGTLTRCETATRDGYLTFATNHFSTYVIVEQTGAISPRTGAENVIFVWGMAAVAAAVCGVCLFRKKAVANRH